MPLAGRTEPTESWMPVSINARANKGIRCLNVKAALRLHSLQYQLAQRSGDRQTNVNIFT